jgi:diguanylate cyclase (GGDEF)-like protein
MTSSTQATLLRRETNVLPENASLPKEGMQHLQQEQTLQLVYALHSTLDIPTILQVFAQETSHALACTGISYAHKAENLAVTIGQAAEFSFHYNLSVNNDSLGEIHFFKNQAFSEAEVLKLEDLLCFLVNPLKNALEHLDVLQSALHDELTGLGNRSALMPTLHRDMELAKRHGSPFSVLAFDIDFFKSINDTYGHLAGDAYLRAFAQSLKETLRESDMIYRSGGEEFIAILANTDTEGAKILAERLCQKLGELQCDYQDQILQTTTSIGIACLKAEDTETTLLDRADKALYQAKNSGRNRVCTE